MNIIKRMVKSFMDALFVDYKCMFCGDFIFRDNIGRCDLPTGNYETIESSIKNKIYSLKDETVVYPGHGNKTTVGYEKINNGFITE